MHSSVGTHLYTYARRYISPQVWTDAVYIQVYHRQSSKCVSTTRRFITCIRSIKKQKAKSKKIKAKGLVMFHWKIFFLEFCATAQQDLCCCCCCCRVNFNIIIPSGHFSLKEGCFFFFFSTDKRSREFWPLSLFFFSVSFFLFHSNSLLTRLKRVFLHIFFSSLHFFLVLFVCL